MIKLIPYSQIDFLKYDACVMQSAQYRYSATSHFLAATAGKNWAVFVKGDYQAVMPVPFIRKLGFRIVVHPKLCQQLGVFSSQDSSSENEEFLKALRKRCIVWYYAFNQNNTFKSQLETRQNFILKRNKYTEIFQKYSPKRKRKLRLDEEVSSHSFWKEVSLEEVQDFIKKYQLGYTKAKDEKEYFKVLQSLTQAGNMRYYAFFYHDEVINLIALYIEQNVVALLGTYNIKEKIKLNGSSKLMDFVISKWIETHDFDFEGSDIPAVEEFFRGFRPSLHLYTQLRFTKKQLILHFFRAPITAIQNFL